MRHHSESLKASFPENLIVYVLKCKHNNIEETILSAEFKPMLLLESFLFYRSIVWVLISLFPKLVLQNIAKHISM